MTENRRVTVDDLENAWNWLRVNEGTDGEAESCDRVADWISKEIDRRKRRAKQ